MALTFAKVCKHRFEFFKKADGPERKPGERACLEGFKEKTTASVLRSLLSLKYQVSGYGSIKVLNGDESGWRDIKLGWQMEELGFRSAFHRFEGGQFSNIPLNKLAIFLCTSVVIGESVLAKKLLRQAIVGAPKGLGKDREWKNSTFARFVFTMLAEHFGMNMSKVVFPGDHPLDGFEVMFKSWDSKTQMNKALRWLCDYHLNGTKATNAHPKGEFVTMPYDVFPVEVLTTKFVWEQVSGETLSVKHDLIANNPLANVPVAFSPVEDQFLMDFEAKLIKGLPDLPKFKHRRRKSIAAV